MNFVNYNKALPWHSGKPTYPNMQLSHRRPENMALHKHCPLVLSQISVSEPVLSQSQANEKMAIFQHIICTKWRLYS